MLQLRLHEKHTYSANDYADVAADCNRKQGFCPTQFGHQNNGKTHIDHRGQLDKNQARFESFAQSMRDGPAGFIPGCARVLLAPDQPVWKYPEEVE